MVLILILPVALSASEQYRLWDGRESVADYAKRIDLPSTESLDLGNSVRLDLVLIPAGKFVMGTPEPIRVDVYDYKRRIIMVQSLFAAGVGSLAVLLIFVFIRAIHVRRRPQFSLRRLILITLVAGICILSGLFWRKLSMELTEARLEYVAAMARYRIASEREKPAHLVVITKPYYSGMFLVTQEQYRQVIGKNPSHFNSNKNNPVETVDWNDATAFCKKLSAQMKHSIRLPTEAEWEYMCRAGSRTIFYSGDTVADLDRVAWHSSNSKGTTHPVGLKEPNVFGLYDMLGNVLEWCEDKYGEDYYRESVVEDPQGPSRGDWRIMRGGLIDSCPMECRSAFREGIYPIGSGYGLGFRVVMQIK